MTTAENIKNLAIRASANSVITDFGVDVMHIAQKHLGTDMSICTRIIEEEVKENKQDFIASRFLAKGREELEPILQDIVTEYVNNHAEEISLWYEGANVATNIEKGNKYNAYTAEFSSDTLAGVTSQYNPRQGAFCIKESQDYRITIHRTKDGIYNGVKCPSIYPIKTEENELHYYIRVEDVFENSNFSNIQKLFFIEKNKPYFSQNSKLNIHYKVNRYNGQDEIVICKDIKKPYRFTINIQENGILVKLRNKESNGKPVSFNYNDETFIQKYPHTYKLIAQTMSDLEFIKENNLPEIFPQRDSEGLKRANKLYDTYNSFTPKEPISAQKQSQKRVVKI